MADKCLGCGGKGFVARPDGPAEWCSCSASEWLLKKDPTFVLRWNVAWIERGQAAPIRAAASTAVAWS